jgi:hypothetical protein
MKANGTNLGCCTNQDLKDRDLSTSEMREENRTVG